MPLRRRAAFLAILMIACSVPALTARSRPAPVTVTEGTNEFTLSNGIITAQVNKRTGDLTSMTYHGIEVLTDKSGHAGGYWSHDTTGGKAIVDRITIDPKDNGGERGEVSVKGISGGIPMGHGPGTGPGGDIPADITIRYTLGRGDSGIYTYCEFDHLPAYGAASMTEARYCAKLASMFDWLSVSKNHDKYYPHEIRGADKYQYTAIQYDNPAYGWSSTTKKIGFWFINPSVEYLSGGPTKPEFLCHRDTTPVQAPCVLNYWRSSHYGGAAVIVREGEHWTKVIGPFLIYVNSGGDHAALYADAKAQAKKEAAKWPYAWVEGVDYPHRDQRTSVMGQLVLKDPLAPKGSGFSGRVMVGLTAPAQTYDSGPGPSRTINWQTDAKHYEFWVKATPEADGKTMHFTISNVRPGAYTLHAFADGVLGEYTRKHIEVAGHPKSTMSLGTMDWTPVRDGRQLWDIGIPNRTSLEFAGADRYFEADAPLKYAREFPHDVHYTIGKSDYAKDWYFEQVPHNVDPNARVAPFRGIRSKPGNPTPYTISFTMPDQPQGTATLRLAICGTGARTIDVKVNGKDAGQVELERRDGVITRHQAQGIWYQRQLAFDASMMKPGKNTLTLTVPAGPIDAGVVYDYIRLELKDKKS